MAYIGSLKLLPTSTPTLLGIAWAAGIYEGEGWCRDQGLKGRTISIAQKDPEILRLLKMMFGGSIYLRRTGCCDLVLGGENGRNFVEQTKKYLSSRRLGQLRKAGFIETE